VDESFARRPIADHLAVRPDEVRDGALFGEDLGAGSLDLVELTILLETELGAAIGAEESEPCLSVGDAFRLLREKSTAG
jgi:acyl carrier protein